MATVAARQREILEELWNAVIEHGAIVAAGDRSGVIENEGDLARRIAFRLRGRRRLTDRSAM